MISLFPAIEALYSKAATSTTKRKKSYKYATVVKGVVIKKHLTKSAATKSANKICGASARSLKSNGGCSSVGSVRKRKPKRSSCGCSTTKRKRKTSRVRTVRAKRKPAKKRVSYGAGYGTAY